MDTIHSYMCNDVCIVKQAAYIAIGIDMGSKRMCSFYFLTRINKCSEQEILIAFG